MAYLSLVLALLISQPGPGETISVHEWGVVLYSAGSTTAVGSADYDPLMSVCVDAPVLFFHGPAFSGDVTVCSLGEIVHPYPEPDVLSGGLTGDLGGLGSAVRWTGLDIFPEAPSDMPVMEADDGLQLPGFGWAAYLWRIPEASWVSRSSDSFQDRFLYYEVDLTGVGFPVPLAGYAPAFSPDPELFTGQVLEFRRDPYGTVACTQDQPVVDVLSASDQSSLPIDADRMSRVVVPEAIREWCGSILTEEELQAMWSTWEPYVMYGDWPGDRLLVFPIPEALVERISLIIVSPDEDQPVTLHRFFLGMFSLEGPEG